MDQKERIGLCLFVLLLVLVPVTTAMTSCPDFVRVERDTVRFISCKSDSDVIDFYWYKGNANENRLVCELVQGRKNVPGEYQRYYDVSNSGELIILNADLHHESMYTLAAFDGNGISHEAYVVVNITVTPNPPCPIINGCRPCADCIINEPKESETLTCSITGARPLIQLSWNITSQSGISFVRYEVIEQHNRDMDSWDTYLLLDYKVTKPCGAHAKLLCKADDIAKITSSTIAAFEISNERCSDDIPATEAAPIGFPLGVLVALIIVLVVIIITCLLIGCLIYNKKRSTLPDIKGGHRVGETILPLLPSKGKKISRESLNDALAIFYEKFCSLKPLPWGEPIPIASLYTDFQCVVTPIKISESTLEENNELKNINSSDNLFASSCFKNASRVMFIADLGYGKTTMTQQVVHHWIKEEKANFILIYIQLKEFDINKSIAEVVKDMLPGSMKATVEDIKKVLEGNRCLVLMDGLDELSMTVRKCISEEAGGFKIVQIDPDQEAHHPKAACHELNLGDLLKGKITSLDSQMRVWVTSREVDNMKTPFPPPHVKIKMTGFSSNQVDACIRKTCQYYCQFVNGSETETIKVLVDDVANQVKENLEKDDIIQEFLKTPLLLVLIIHILTAKVTGAVTYLKDLQLTKLTTLIRTVITCLESRYVQKIQDNSIQSKIEEVERKLGVIAWQQRLKITNYDRKGWDKLLGKENVELALSIGLLRLSKDISYSNLQMRQLAFTSFTGVEFYHQYFQEYLAGQYFSTEEYIIQQLEESLKKDKDDKTIRFLQFMSGSRHPSVDKVSKIFLKQGKMWNNFIDFIYETEDQEKVKSYLEDLSKTAKKLGRVPVINFKYLDKKYHQDAVSAFCENCNKLYIKMRSFTFREDCPFMYLTGLVLPQLQRLELLNMVISEEDFVSILEWISQQKLPEIFQFTGCTLAELVSDRSKEKIKTAMEGKKLNIYRSKTTSQTRIWINYFNTMNGNWGKEWFPKNQ